MQCPATSWHNVRGGSSLTASASKVHSTVSFRRQQVMCQAAKGSSKTNLRQVPGIGRKNEQLLLSAQVTDIGQLAIAFQQRGCDERAMMEWLLKDVGIRKHHCASILEYLTKMPMDYKACTGSNVTLSVEGNISAGKTTFLRMLTDQSKVLDGRLDELQALQRKLQVVYEPVDTWQNAKGGKDAVNILDLFYQEPARYAYTFQNYVFLTRMLQEQHSRQTSKAVRMLERSVFSDRHVFVRAVHELHWLSQEELTIYDSIFTPFLETYPDLIPDGFVYLRANPTTCMDRMKRRDRSEESTVKLEYLESLHCKHEDWLVDGSISLSQLNRGVAEAGDTRSQQEATAALACDTPTEVISFKEKLLVGPVDPVIQGNLRFLQTSRRPDLEQQLHNTPVLILDCSKEINVEEDSKAKEYFAEQVNAFHDYISNLKADQEKQRHYDRKHRHRHAQLSLGSPTYPANGLGGVLLNGSVPTVIGLDTFSSSAATVPA